MLVLKRLKIKRYRNVRPGTELRFDGGVNLVLGQNAAGKTSLLSLLSAVCRSAFDQIENEEFELEYELQNNCFTVTADVHHLRKPSDETDAVFGAGPVWNDSFEIAIINHATQETTGISSSTSSAKLVMDWSFIGAALSNRGQDLTELRNALLQEYAFAFRFDESIECFLTITGRQPSTPGPATAPLAVSGVAEGHDQHGAWRTTAGTFVPMKLGHALENAFREATSPRDLMHLGEAGEQLGHAIANALAASQVTIRPNVLSFNNAKNDRHFAVNGFTFEITRSDGNVIHHDHLSYGQKRMLAFFYYLAGNSSAVIADELVNGLHHQWIDRCMDALKDRQAFLTSQNPLLFDYVEFGSPQMVRDRFITCKLERVDGREQMVWENMSAVDAKRFYDDYEVGIMHVGDILKIKGLW